MTPKKKIPDESEKIKEDIHKRTDCFDGDVRIAIDLLAEKWKFKKPTIVTLSVAMVDEETYNSDDDDCSVMIGGCSDFRAKDDWFHPVHIKATIESIENDLQMLKRRYIEFELSRISSTPGGSAKVKKIINDLKKKLK